MVPMARNNKKDNSSAQQEPNGNEDKNNEEQKAAAVHFKNAAAAGMSAKPKHAKKTFVGLSAFGSNAVTITTPKPAPTSNNWQKEKDKICWTFTAMGELMLWVKHCTFKSEAAWTKPTE
jgi:hypothetical protein